MIENLLKPVNSWDELSNICTLIISDGANLLGVSYGQLSLLMFGILLPSATILFLASAGLALSGKKIARRIAMGLLGIGVIALAAFVALAIYALVFGSTWAHTSYV